MDVAQAQQIERVKSRIGNAVLAFCGAHIGQEFHASALRDYVTEQCQVAPASPDRILRDLRLRGQLAYTVVDRRQSLYRVDRVGVQEFTGRLF